MFEIILYLLAGLIFCLVVIKLYHMRQRHQAAANVIFAKYTYAQLAKSEQKTVHDKSVELVKRSSTVLRGYCNDVERYGWYALAMDQLNIPSATPDNSMWYKVKNPYKAVLPGDMLLSGISMHLLREYDIDVAIASEVTAVKKSKQPK